MKKLLLIIALLISSHAFTQVSDVKYFGGIYEKQIYFNFVMHNEDTCYFVVEISTDGRDFYEIFCDSVRPMPVAILHGVQIATNDTAVCMRVTVETKNVIMYFPSEDFQANKYTYVSDILVTRSRPVHARF